MKFTFSLIFAVIVMAIFAPTPARAQSQTFCAETMCPIWCAGLRDYSACLCDCVTRCYSRSKPAPKKAQPADLLTIKQLLTNLFEWKPDVPMAHDERKPIEGIEAQ